MSLIETRIQNTRAVSRLDKNETRPSRYGGIDIFAMQSEDPSGILTEDLKTKAANMVASDTLETPVFDFDAGVTISNTRSAIIADDENTSRMVAINFATYSWGFTSVPALHMNNEKKMQEDFNQKFNKYLFEFAKQLDSDAIAALIAAKTQVINDPLNYTVVADSIQVPYAERDNILGDIDPIMDSNDHFREIHLLGNGGLQSIINKLRQHGDSNDRNKILEYIDKTLHYSSRIPNDVGEFANFFAVSGGSLGMLTRFEREALLNTVSRDGHEWGIDTLPMINLPVGTYYYDSVGDFSGIAGASSADMTRVRKEHFGFAVDVAFLTGYNSDPATIAHPIVKASVLTA